MTLSGGHGTPLTPDAPEARRWLVDELAKPEYQAARPTWFDQASNAVWTWFTSLFSTHGSAQPAPLALVLALIAFCLVAAAFVVFGRPRLNRRSRLAAPVLGGDDTRDSRALRRSAESAARAADWSLAVEELFRAIARELDERALITLRPGSTAQEIARLTGGILPGLAPELSEAARTFDSVRYLGGRGTESDYARLVALDAQLRSAREIHRPALVGGST